MDMLLAYDTVSRATAKTISEVTVPSIHGVETAHVAGHWHETLRNTRGNVVRRHCPRWV